MKKLLGISKNSLFAIFSRLRGVVTRRIIASYNIAFSKLPLKTEVFRGNLLLLAAVCGGLFLSCGTELSEGGWYTDFDAAKKAASHQKKNLLLFVNSFHDFDGAAESVAALTGTPDFTKSLKDCCICVHFDFTDADIFDEEKFESLAPKEQKAAERRRNTLQKQFAVADAYQIRSTPELLLLTRHGYFIAEIEFGAAADAHGYAEAVRQRDEAAEEMNALAAAALNAAGLEKISAIDKLYLRTPESYRLLLSSLYRKIPELDKNDESGLVSKYLTATAHADAYEKYKQLKAADAAEIYQTAAENERLSANDRQSLYYAAANAAGSIGMQEVERVLELLQKSLEAAPESVEAAAIQASIEQLRAIQQDQDAAADGQNAS